MGPPEFTGGNIFFSFISLQPKYASMGPPEFTGGNTITFLSIILFISTASMGPPEFTGGNEKALKSAGIAVPGASMGPPEFTGGNSRCASASAACFIRFNGAAGIHRRKPGWAARRGGSR